MVCEFEIIEEDVIVRFSEDSNGGFVFVSNFVVGV